MAKTAIILGATGLTGGLLLQQLLNDSRYSKVKLFSRRSCGIEDSKIEEHIVDLFHLEQHKNEFTADDLFCCIGTTKAKTKDEDLYTKIDYGIPVTSAKLAKENNIKTIVVISALGADAKSSIFYNHTKGKMENDVLLQNIENSYILQPSLIGGKREESRLGEYSAKVFMKLLNPFLIGKLKKYKSILPETIVNTMVFLANNDFKSGRIESDQIQRISKNK